MLYIEIIKVRDLDVLPNARYTQSHGKWAEKDRNFAVTLTIEPVFMRVTREGVKIMVVLAGVVAQILNRLNDVMDAGTRNGAGDEVVEHVDDDNGGSGHFRFSFFIEFRMR